MKRTLWYLLKKRLFTFIGDIRWSGLKRPLWLTINALSYQLKGKHYRSVGKVIRPGDILIRRFEGYLDKIFIPGYWNHAGIYVGKDEDGCHLVIHATSDGVWVEDLIDFMRTDHVVVLRECSGSMVNEAISRAEAAIGAEYDFDFNFADSLRFSCTELVNHCYQNIFAGKKRLGKMMLTPDDIVNSTSVVEKVYESGDKK